MIITDEVNQLASGGGSGWPVYLGVGCSVFFYLAVSWWMRGRGGRPR